MAVVECPKCGRAADEGAIICPGCDYILDASFLGDDITDDERDRRPKVKDSEPASGRGRASTSASGPMAASKSPRVDFGEDAMILGNLGDAEVSSFKSRDAGLSQREVTQTKFYIGGAVAQLMEHDAIPEIAAGVSGASIRMTPFERHVLGFVNGRRSIGRIHKKSAMEESEFKTAVAMLADKGFIRLKGWKKPRPAGSSTGHSATGSATGSAVGAPRPAPRSAAIGSGPMRSQASQVSQVVGRPPEPERTIVASMEHIEAIAKLQKDADGPRSRRPRRSPVPDQVSIVDTPVSPMPVARSVQTDGRGFSEDVATRVVGNPTLSVPPPAVPSRRFASLQAGVPDSVGEQSVHRDRPAPSSGLVSATADIAADGLVATANVPTIGEAANDADDVGHDREARSDAVDPLAAAAAAAWDADDNQSSVFAEVSSASLRVPTAPAASKDDDAADDVFGEGADPGRTGAFEVLRDPTGMGDSPDDLGAGAGAAVDDHGGDGDGDGEPFASAEALSSEGRLHRAADDADAEDDADDADDADADEAHDDEPGATDAEVDLGPARRIHDEVTAAPVGAPGEGDDDDFVGAPPTAHIVRPMTLPSEALSPIVVEAPRLTVPAAVSGPMPVMAVVAAPTALAPPTAPTAPAPPMSLPGQLILKSGDAGFTPLATAPTAPSTAIPTPPASKPIISTRVSAASQVPFELRKKAERIYEQAIKDIGEGRVSSAMMNAKLAMNFDPTVDAYRELHEELVRQKSAPKGAGARPQELVLFEQASDAEGRGDYLKAVALLEQAIALNPRAGALHNRIGVVLSIRLKRHDEALAHLKKAIELEPGSIVYMNNFSKVTGLLESVIEKAPRKRGQQDQNDRVAVKKIRPKMF